MQATLSELELEALKYVLKNFRYGTGLHDGHWMQLEDLALYVDGLLNEHRTGEDNPQPQSN